MTWVVYLGVVSLPRQSPHRRLRHGLMLKFKPPRLRRVSEERRQRDELKQFCRVGRMKRI